MKTRKAFYFQEQRLMMQATTTKRVFSGAGDGDGSYKRRRFPPVISSPEETSNGADLFDLIPDDLVLSILCRVSSTARCPTDFINVLLTCKRLNSLATNSMVLSRISPKALAIKAKNWRDSAHRFLKRCVDAGSLEASYTLGMIRFYCLQNMPSGASLMAKAAIRSHAPALYSLSVIQFNGSGGCKNDKDLRAGVALCARAASLGHVDALRELGHCLQDGYGVQQNVSEGRRFLVQANARELAVVLSSTASSGNQSRSWPTLAQPQIQNPNQNQIRIPNQFQNPNQIGNPNPNQIQSHGCPLLSDFGCNVPSSESHPANRFLAEWFGIRGGNVPGVGLRLCSHAGCGRPETRIHEFRRCSVCGAVNYCSRACQALDWKLRHKVECTPAEHWLEEDGEVGEGNVDFNDNVNGDNTISMS